MGEHFVTCQSTFFALSGCICYVLSVMMVRQYQNMLEAILHVILKNVTAKFYYFVLHLERKETYNNASKLCTEIF